MKEPNYDKCNKKTVNSYLQHYEMSGHDANRDLKAAVGALGFAMLKNLNGRAVATCDNCGGDSDPELSDCPYCGDTEEEPEVVDTTGEETKQEQNMTTKGSAERKGKKTGKKKSSSKKKPGATPAKVSKKKGGKASKKKGGKGTGHPAKKTRKKAGKKKAGKADKKPKADKIDLNSKDLVSTKQLEASITKVQELKVRGMETMWDLGKELDNIYSKKLWTQKTTPDGTAVYDSFKAFVSHEFGFTAAHAYRLMDVAIHFTKKQVLDVGVTKLNVLVRVSPEQREEFLKRAPNTSRSKLSQEVAQLVEGQPARKGRGEGFKGGAEATAKGAKARREKAAERRNQANKSGKLTIVRTDARVEVELFKRNTAERATTIKDAVGTEHCANGVVQYYSLLDTPKGLVISIETRREG